MQQTTDSGVKTAVYSGPNTGTSVTVNKTMVVQYAVRACNPNGCSAWKSSSHGTDVEPPGGPLIIDAGSTP